MKGLMQDVPLTLSMIFRRAEQLFLTHEEVLEPPRPDRDG